jgi:hypothetical protein
MSLLSAVRKKYGIPQQGTDNTDSVGSLDSHQAKTSLHRTDSTDSVGCVSPLEKGFALKRPETLSEFRAALRGGALQLCCNCQHFSRGADPGGLGRCSRFNVETFAVAPFWCFGYKLSTNPMAPEYAAQTSATTHQSGQPKGN